MARILYSDDITFKTTNLSLVLNSQTGILSTTYSINLPAYSFTAASYSTNTTFTENNNFILTNSASTFTLPTNPANGTTLIIRNAAGNIPTLSAGTYSIRNINETTGTQSIQLVANGSYMFTYFNSVWYGI